MVQGSQFRYEEQQMEDKGAYPPNILPLDGGETVRDNDRYRVRDFELKDFTGNIILWTVTITELKNGQQTIGHSHQEGPELYYFQKGRGLLILKNDAKHVKPGLHVAIPKGIFHKVIASSNDDMLFLTYFQGALNRPKEKFRAT